MTIIPNLTGKIKTALLILVILASALAFAIPEPEPVRRVVPDLIIFEQAEQPEGRPVFVTANGRTWVFEL